MTRIRRCAQLLLLCVSRICRNSGASLGASSICDGVAGNLVANCDFETGNFTGWTFSGSTSSNGVTNPCQTLGSLLPSSVNKQEMGRGPLPRKSEPTPPSTTSRST